MRRPLHEMSAGQIHSELVTDAINGILTPLDRVVEGVERIAYLRRIPLEEAFLEVKDEANQRGAVGVFL